MANKRNLKKDIQYMTEVILADATIVSEILVEEAELQQIEEVMVAAVEMYNELISRVNNPDGKDNPALVKQHYKKIQQDLLSKYDELSAKVYTLAKVQI